MNTEVLKENRARGWAAVAATAPAWVRAYVIEVRTAYLEERNIRPNFLRAFIQGCEKRSLAAFARSGRRPAVLPAQLTAVQVLALSKRTHQSFEDILFGKSSKVNEDAWLRERAANYAKRIAVDAAKRYDDDDFTDDDPDDWDWDDDDSEKKHRRKAEAHRTLAQKAPDVFASIPQSRAASLHDVAATKRDRESHFAAQNASRALRKKK
jgi:hypothetical protein